MPVIYEENSLYTVSCRTKPTPAIPSACALSPAATAIRKVIELYVETPREADELVGSVSGWGHLTALL
jgi:hypothetical protein